MAFIDFRGVGGITDLLSFGNVGEVPYTNAAGDDFDYSSNLIYSSGSLNIKGEAYNPLIFQNIDTPNGGCRIEIAGNFSQELYINTDFNDITATSKFGIKTSNVQAFLINEFRGVSIGPTDIASNSYVLAAYGNTHVEEGTFSVKGADNTTGVNTLLTSLDGTELFTVLNNGTQLHNGGRATGAVYDHANNGGNIWASWGTASSQIHFTNASSPFLELRTKGLPFRIRPYGGGKNSVQIHTYYPGGTSLTVVGAGGTGNLQEWWNNGNNILSVVNASGHLGIGTTSPTTALDVRGGVNSSHATFTGQSGRGLVISTENTLSNDDGVSYNAQMTSGKHLFKTNSIERMRIDTNGNVGIGTTSPTSRLQVNGLSTYADNATAVAAGLTAGALYIRTGHGLDIVT